MHCESVSDSGHQVPALRVQGGVWVRVGLCQIVVCGTHLRDGPGDVCVTEDYTVANKHRRRRDGAPRCVIVVRSVSVKLRTGLVRCVGHSSVITEEQTGSVRYCSDRNL